MAGTVFRRCSRCGKRLAPRATRCCEGASPTWTFTADVGRGADGKRRQRMKGGFPSRREAERALRELLGQVDGQTYVAPSKLTVADFVAEWLPAIRATVRATTHAQYTSMLTTYVVPALGSVALHDLTPAHVNAMYGALLESGRRDGGALSPKTVRHVHVALRKALADAVRWGRVQRNVAASADPPRPATPELKVWTAEEVRGFLSYAREDRLYAAWLLLATTGLRRGELLALTWLDLDAGRLSVRRAVTVVNGKPVATEPKTARGRRTLALDPVTLAELREHRRRQLAERIAHADVWQDSNLIFCLEDGSPLHPEALSRRFALLAAKAGLPAIGLHGVRHSYATAALTSGVSPKIVSERLGHASVSITLDTYSHVLPSYDEAAAVAIAGVILGTP